MTKLPIPKFLVRAAITVLVLSLVLGVSSASAARDRTPPTTPTNLRVTGMTPYSVSLAWTPSPITQGASPTVSAVPT